MQRPQVPDQQRILMIDEQFKKETVRLSNTAIREVQKASKMRRYNSARIKQLSIQAPLNSVHRSKARLQSTHSYRRQDHQCDEVVKISDNRTQYPIDNQEYNRIGNKGCRQLSKMVSPTLIQLQLNNNQIDSSGITHLSKSQWPKLKSIDLFDNKIGQQGIDNLLKSGWSNIRSLYLSLNGIRKYKIVWLVLGEWMGFKEIILLDAIKQNEKQINYSAQRHLISEKYQLANLFTFKMELSYYKMIFNRLTQS